VHTATRSSTPSFDVGDRRGATGRILAFDADAGSLAYVDKNGVPGRIDLRSERSASRRVQS
jgi:hypothetical protein